MKPVPKRELVTRVGKGNTIAIYAASDDAASFAKSLSDYGYLYSSTESGHFALIVNPIFDFYEVLQYIDSYGGDD